MAEDFSRAKPCHFQNLSSDFSAIYPAIVAALHDASRVRLCCTTAIYVSSCCRTAGASTDCRAADAGICNTTVYVSVCCSAVLHASIHCPAALHTNIRSTAANASVRCAPAAYERLAAQRAVHLSPVAVRPAGLTLPAPGAGRVQLVAKR